MGMFIGIISGADFLRIPSWNRGEKQRVDWSKERILSAEYCKASHQTFKELVVKKIGVIRELKDSDPLV